MTLQEYIDHSPSTASASSRPSTRPPSSRQSDAARPYGRGPQGEVISEDGAGLPGSGAVSWPKLVEKPDIELRLFPAGRESRPENQYLRGVVPLDPGVRVLDEHMTRSRAHRTPAGQSVEHRGQRLARIADHPAHRRGPQPAFDERRPRSCARRRTRHRGSSGTTPS